MPTFYDQYYTICVVWMKHFTFYSSNAKELYALINILFANTNAFRNFVPISDT